MNSQEYQLKGFQATNCKGCKFADKKKVGSGKPCCQYAFGLDVQGDKCNTRREH